MIHQKSDQNILSAPLYSTLAATIILSAVFLVQLKITLLVSDFNFVYFFDPDSAFQSEQFLLNMSWPGVKEIHSSPVAYGSELLYMIVPFRLLTSIFEWNDPIYAFYFINITHSLCSTLSLFFIFMLLSAHKVKPWWNLSWLLLVASSPLFFNNSFIQKPDANVVLLFLVLAITGIRGYLIRWHVRWYMLAVICSGAAAATKWWGLWMVFPLIYIRAQIFFINRSTILKNTNWINHDRKWIFAAYMVVYILLCNFFNAIHSQSYSPAFLKITQSIPSKLWHFILVGLGVLFLAWTTDKFYQVFAHILSNKILTNNHLTRWQYLLFAPREMAILFITYATLNIPFFLQKDQLVKHCSFFFSYLMIPVTNATVGRSTPIGIFDNIMEWISAFHQMGMLTASWCAFYFLGLLAFLKPKTSAVNQLFSRAMVLYTFGLLSFLMIFVTKKNDATTAMLQPLAAACVFISLSNNMWFSSLRKKLLISGLVAFQILQNFVFMHIETRYQPLLKVYHTYSQTLAHAYNAQYNFISHLGENLPPNLKIYTHGQELPFSSNSSNVKMYDSEEFIKKLSDPNLTKNTLYVTGDTGYEKTKHHIELLVESGKIEFVKNFSIQKYSRGSSEPGNVTFWVYKNI